MNKLILIPDSSLPDSFTLTTLVVLAVSGSHVAGYLWYMLPAKMRLDILVLNLLVKGSVLTLFFRVWFGSFADFQNVPALVVFGIVGGIFWYAWESGSPGCFQKLWQDRCCGVKKTVLLGSIALAEELIYRCFLPLMLFSGDSWLFNVLAVVTLSLFFGLEHIHMGTEEFKRKFFFSLFLYSSLWLGGSFLIPAVIHLQFNFLCSLTSVKRTEGLGFILVSAMPLGLFILLHPDWMMGWVLCFLTGLCCVAMGQLILITGFKFGYFRGGSFVLSRLAECSPVLLVSVFQGVPDFNSVNMISVVLSFLVLRTLIFLRLNSLIQERGP